MDTLWQDARFAVRVLVKSPSFVVVAILSLAVGIGANTAIFSVIRGVLFAELPYPESDRLVQVWNTYPLMDLPIASVSIPDYFDRREGVEAFAESALYNYRSFNLTGDGPPERLIGAHATATLFPLLETEAWIGRTGLGPAEIEAISGHILAAPGPVREALFEIEDGRVRILKDRKLIFRAQA